MTSGGGEPGVEGPRHGQSLVVDTTGGSVNSCEKSRARDSSVPACSALHGVNPCALKDEAEHPGNAVCDLSTGSDGELCITSASHDSMSGVDRNPLHGDCGALFSNTFTERLRAKSGGDDQCCGDTTLTATDRTHNLDVAPQSGKDSAVVFKRTMRSAPTSPADRPSSAKQRAVDVTANACSACPQTCCSSTVVCMETSCVSYSSTNIRAPPGSMSENYESASCCSALRVPRSLACDAAPLCCSTSQLSCSYKNSAHSCSSGLDIHQTHDLCQQRDDFLTDPKGGYSSFRCGCRPCFVRPSPRYLHGAGTTVEDLKQVFVKRRTSANARERRRMESMNVAYDHLRDVIPSFGGNRKLSKFETLQMAQTYIAALEDVLQR
ncbi:uncharacterized protein [Littorina saxatilis]|uniref:BHLH domain-containing protein n=1 Tax=Littorina saxatilis TaxID=31220 RepID=A0AAN9GKC8_9CAEN